MPKELRKIMFTADELQAAVINHCLHAGKTLPKGRIERLQVSKTPEAMVILHFDVENANGSEVVLSREAVGAALIRYCMQNDIPLPRSAGKGVQPDGDGIALMCNFVYAVD